MRPYLPAVFLLACSVCLPGCLTRTKPAPVAISPAETPEYKNALGRLLRVPDKHPLLDEGLVPLPALELAIVYQEAVKKNRYRDLAPSIRPVAKANFQQELEDDLLRRETRETPQLAVLTDIVRGRTNDGGGIYQFQFTALKRDRSAKHVLSVEVAPNGAAAITELR